MIQDLWFCQTFHMKSTDIDCNIYYLKNGLRVDFILFQSVEQYGKDMVLMKKRKWRLNICFIRYYLDNNDGEYRCRSKVPVNEIMKIVRMYEPIITEFFNNEEEMAKFNKWRDEQKLLEQNKLSEDGEEKKNKDVGQTKATAETVAFTFSIVMR